VSVITYNSAQYIETCLRSVFRQTHRPMDVVVVDNASSDSTLTILARFERRIRLIRNDRNLGFAAAQNQAIAASVSDWALVLNPDAALEPGFVQQLLEGGLLDRRVGAVCGRLL